MARLVENYREIGTMLNITANAGVHYNGVKIVDVYEDFIVIEGDRTGERSGGNWRGGRVNVNIATITRLEEVSDEHRIRLNLRGERGI